MDRLLLQGISLAERLRNRRMPNGTYGGVRGQVNTKVGDKHPMISVYLLLDYMLDLGPVLELMLTLLQESS